MRSRARRETKATWIANLSHGANIALAVVGIVSFLFGIYQFSKTQQEQREQLEFDRVTKAIDLFVKYNDLMREAAAKKSHENTAVVEWRNNLSLAIAESIWNLTVGNPEWENTVKGMLEDQDKMERIDDLDCSTYSDSFTEAARQTLNHEVCALPDKSLQPVQKPRDGGGR